MIEQDKVLAACSYHVEVLAKSPQSGGRQRFCSMTLFFLEIVLRADGTCCIYQPEPRILALWQRGQKVVAGRTYVVVLFMHIHAQKET